MTVKEHIAKLQKHYKPDETICISTIWSTEDIITEAEDLNESYSSATHIPSIEEANEILNAMEVNHDCTLGTTWDTIDYYIIELSKEKEN